MRVQIAVFALAIFAGSSLTVAPARSLAADTGFTTCPVFTASQWTNAFPPYNSGTKYQITMMGKPMSCAQAETWARKFVATHISPPKNMPQQAMPLNGPPGFKCQGSPDKNSHAWRGNCLKIGKAAFSPSITWTNAS